MCALSLILRFRSSRLCRWVHRVYAIDVEGIVHIFRDGSRPTVEIATIEMGEPVYATPAFTKWTHLHSRCEEHSLLHPETHCQRRSVSATGPAAMARKWQGIPGR